MTDNAFSKLARRREHKDLDKLNHFSLGDSKVALVDMLGVRDKQAGVARALHRRSGQLHFNNPTRLAFTMEFFDSIKEWIPD